MSEKLIALPSFLHAKMEALIGQQFAMGVVRKKTKQQKKDEARKARDQRIKERQKEDDIAIENYYKRIGLVRRPEYTPKFIIKNRRWLLLPQVPMYVSIFMYHAGDNLTEILETIQRRRKQKHDVEKMKYMMVIARKNQRVRTAFGALARRWIRSRLQAGNDEDLVTGCSPVQPMVLTDWKNRRRYVFEPQTIMKDMVTRLQMSHCTLFPKPKFPRNPYTNTDMTAGQFFSLVKQLRAAGFAHWTVEALYSVEYNLKIYEQEMYFKLKNTILHGLFSNHRDAAGIELVLEFIEDEHQGHRLHCDDELYKWALENVPSHHHIVAWRNLCYKHYKIGNTIPPHPDADSIALESRYLCRKPYELEARRAKSNNSETASSVSN
jgi:hypothetical protein